MSAYNSIEYSDVYWKTSGSLWQYFRDESALDNNNNIIDFPANNINNDSNNKININNDNNNNIDNILSKFKENITGSTGDNSTKDVNMLMLSKYPSNF